MYKRQGFERDGANNAIHFYYRNDELAAENNLASFAGKVSIVINGQKDVYKRQYSNCNDGESRARNDPQTTKLGTDIIIIRR